MIEMLFDKPSNKITGRRKFYGVTPYGHKISGFFFRIKKRSLQIKVGKIWRVVNTISIKEFPNV